MKLQRAVEAHTFNPSTWEVEAGRSLSLRPAWSIGQPDLHREILSRKKTKTNKHTTNKKQTVCRKPLLRVFYTKPCQPCPRKASSSVLWDNYRYMPDTVSQGLGITHFSLLWQASGHPGKTHNSMETNTLLMRMSCLCLNLPDVILNRLFAILMNTFRHWM